MAHLITNKDNIVLAGMRKAWHGLGVLVEHAPNCYEALNLANLGWTADSYELSANRMTPDGFESIDVEEKKAIVRSDTREVLGVVGKDYTSLQNHEMAKVIDELGKDGNCPRIESAGSLRSGREVFFLARAGSFFADDNGRDQIDQYLLFINGHDGSRSLSVQPTTIRVVCNNTLTAAVTSADKIRTIKRIRHTPSATVEMSKLGDRILAAIKQHATFTEAVAALSQRTLTKDELIKYFSEVYFSFAQPVAGSKRSMKSADRTMADWMISFESDPTNAALCGRTTWGALNTITQWADHNRDSRVDRDYSKLLGPAADIKRDALSLALATL